MVAKKAIVRVMEEFLGEYILNISNENLSLGIIRGKLKLDNVQLDGDLIGGHILNAVGLQGKYAVLSCTAAQLRANIPWSKLEKEPTRCELVGLQLLCVPLLPSNAHHTYGTGSARTTLRTRVKRSALARFERNFFSWRIPGEGPPRPNPTNQRKNRSSRKRSDSGGSSINGDEERTVFSTADDDQSEFGGDVSINMDGLNVPEDMDEKQRETWMMKFSQKLFRNIEVTVRDIHLRCEVCEGALESDPVTVEHNGGEQKGVPNDRRSSFSFGLTCENLIFKSANSKWETGTNVDFSVDRGNEQDEELRYKVMQTDSVAMYWDENPPLLISDCQIMKAESLSINPQKALSRIRLALAAMAKYQDPGAQIRHGLDATKKSKKNSDKSNWPSMEHFYLLSPLPVEVRMTFSNMESPEPTQCTLEVVQCHFHLAFRPRQMQQYRMLKFMTSAQQRFDTMLHQRPSRKPTEDPRAWWRYAISCVMARPNARPWRDVKQITETRDRYMELVQLKHLRSRSTKGYHSGLSQEESDELRDLENILPIEALLSFHLLSLRRVVELTRIKKSKNSRRRRRNRRESSSPMRDQDPSSNHSVSSEPFDDDASFTGSVISAYSFDAASQVQNSPSRYTENRKTSAGRSPLPMSKRPYTSRRFRGKRKNEGEMDDLMSTTMSVSNVSMSSSGSRRKKVEIYFDEEPLEEDFPVLNITHRTFLLQDVSVTATLMDKIYEEPILQATIKARGCAKHKGLDGGTMFWIDIKNFSVNDCAQGAALDFLTFDNKNQMENTVESFANTSHHAGEISLIKLSHNFNESFESLLTDEEMPLPPDGVVFRLLGSIALSCLSLSVSAHPAKLIWNTDRVKAVLESFFPSQSIEPKSILRNQLRNTATPFAHKAQIAMISQRSLSFNLNIDAPKIWFPISEDSLDGALFVDVGRLKISLYKPQLHTKMFLEVDSNNMQVTFIKGLSGLFEMRPGLDLQKNREEGISIVSPFNIHISSERSGEQGPRRRRKESVDETIEESNRMKIEVSKISLNLVDVEVLAIGLGKWYAAELLVVKDRYSKQDESLKTKPISPMEKPSQTNRQMNIVRKSVSLLIEGIELSLEGQSPEKSDSSISKKKKKKLRKRTYLVQVVGIHGKVDSVGEIKNSSIAVDDVSIVQIKRSTEQKSNTKQCPSEELRHHILMCAHRSFSDLNEPSEDPILLSPSRIVEATPKSSEFKPETSNLKHKASQALIISMVHDGDNHLNDIDMNLNYLVVRITPSSLQDCSEALKRVLELIDIMTKEMERRVHAAGRSARNQENTDLTNQLNRHKDRDDASSDSSLLVKVTLKEVSLLIGFSDYLDDEGFEYQNTDTFSDEEVVQIQSSMLLMLQSIENSDCSGTRTFHFSIDNLASSIIPHFATVPASQIRPIIGPIAAEFRSAFLTENSGDKVSQEFSLDCDSVKSCMAPSDLAILQNIVNKISEKIKTFRAQAEVGHSSKALNSFTQYREKGSTIATLIRFEVQPFSFVILSHFKGHKDSHPLFDINGEVRGKLDGGASALAGEITFDVCILSFNKLVSEWEYLIEPNVFQVEIEQLPNELNLLTSTKDYVNLNIANAFLRNMSEMDTFSDTDNNKNCKTPGVSEGRIQINKTIHLSNESGLDIAICPMGVILALGLKERAEFDENDPGCLFVNNNCTKIVDGRFGRFKSVNSSSTVPRIALRAMPRADDGYGERAPFYDLPLYTDNDDFFSKHDLDPVEDVVNQLYSIEPVIEWCIQNQRLKSACTDISNLSNGVDLLSSTVWSPSDQSILFENENWIRPYLDDDVPEWSDLTGALQMSRDRAMLPDDNWVWVNDWKVDTSGDYGKEIDADGWEYAPSFQDFSRDCRFYEQGDLVRRRKWTRTRMIKPPRYDDPCRPLSLVWKCYKNEDGSRLIKVRSHLTIQNNTNIELGFFAYEQSWKGEKFIGSAKKGQSLPVPALLASATYLRLAKKKSSNDGSKLHMTSGYSCSERIMILPSSLKASTCTRTSIFLVRENVLLRNGDPDRIHFLIKIKSHLGVTEVIVEPLLKISNQLPCQLFFRLSGASRDFPDDDTVDCDDISKRNGSDSQSVDSGEISSSLDADPSLNPFISFRVPGYRWSCRQRILNRQATPCTWKANQNEEEEIIFFQSNESYGPGFKGYRTCIEFENILDYGDPLTIVLEIESGHCPVLNVYAQYWILDKSGFGLRFSDGFSDLLGTTQILETSRTTYMLPEEAQEKSIVKDQHIAGHQWSIGKDGMSMFFSEKEKLVVSIEDGEDDPFVKKKNIFSQPSQLLDVSNVLPKTIFALDEEVGQGRFELCYDVSFAPSTFAKTKIISIYPRYHIINLMETSLHIAQEGCLQSSIYVPSQSRVPFHCSSRTMPSKIRLSLNNYEWTNGSFQMDKVGITSMRLPNKTNTPMVIQAEIRLGTKEQDVAVMIVLWGASKDTNPIYLLRNLSRQRIVCNQVLSQDINEDSVNNFLSGGCNPSSSIPLAENSALQDGQLDKPSPCSPNRSSVSDLVTNGLNCGIVNGIFTSDERNLFVWSIAGGEDICFGFDDPDKNHILEWTCRDFMNGVDKFGHIETDAIGSSNVILLSNGEKVGCKVLAEKSTKVIEFYDILSNDEDDNFSILSGLQSKISHHKAAISYQVTEKGEEMENEHVVVSFQVCIPGVSLSFVDNVDPLVPGREVFLAHIEKVSFLINQNRDGEIGTELKMRSFQIDNFVQKVLHPVLVYCHNNSENEPFFHVSAIREFQRNTSSYIFRYVAVRMLAIDVSFDPRTAEAFVRYINPLLTDKRVIQCTPTDWVKRLTSNMIQKSDTGRKDITKDIAIFTSRSDRIYCEQLHLHPIRISVTFTQEWNVLDTVYGSPAILQYIKMMPSLANAQLTFTSFVVGHVFEAPEMLRRIITAHFSSQMTKHLFSIIGSLAILNGPADFLANVGTGVRDFFYEPINGLVHGPERFIEGLENGSISLARGVFLGVVRGAANVTGAVNSNLIELTDEGFIHERKAHQRLMVGTLNNKSKPKTMADSLSLAGASVARGVRSGAMGIVQHPYENFAKEGAAGFVKGMGQAIVGAIVKPVIGVGDGAVLVMNHMSEEISIEKTVQKVPRRLRRALPRKYIGMPQSILLEPYDHRAAKAQLIITSNENSNDVYTSHVYLPEYLIIASEQRLWFVERKSRNQWSFIWEEISNFSVEGRSMKIKIFSQKGLKCHTFHGHSDDELEKLNQMLSMQKVKMGDRGDKNTRFHQGAALSQERYLFGSMNNLVETFETQIEDEIDAIEQCFARVNTFTGDTSTFFIDLDRESWSLIQFWRYFHSGLNVRRCIVAGFVNNSTSNLQIKSAGLVEGASPCYQIPSNDYDESQGLLRPGAAIIFFAWGVPPTLHHFGNVTLNIETSLFTCYLDVKKTQPITMTVLPKYDVEFLERSYDDSGWWAKYWIMITNNGNFDYEK